MDLTDDKIYFINNGKINCFNLDGHSDSSCPQLSVNVGTPEALTVHNNSIYISADGKIYSVSKSGDSKIMRDETPHVNALLLYDTTTRNQGLI